MNGIIYKVTNNINGKCYVGQTTCALGLRKSKHKYISLNPPKTDYFHNAIRKYGMKNFKWEVIYECDEIMLDMMETFKIMVCHSHVSEGNGYNLNWGGGSNRGYKHTEEAKKIMSIKHIGKENPMFGKMGKLSPMFNKHHTDITKKKISDKSIGRKQSDNTKKKKSDEMFKRYENGWIHPMTGKKNINRTILNKQQIGDKNPFYGKHHSKETIEMIGNSHKKYDDNVINTIIELREKELTYKQISDIVNIPFRTVGDLCRKVDIQVTRKKRPEQRKYNDAIRQKAKIMRNNGQSWATVSKELNISIGTIRHWFE